MAIVPKANKKEANMQQDHKLSHLSPQPVHWRKSHEPAASKQPLHEQLLPEYLYMCFIKSLLSLIFFCSFIQLGAGLNWDFPRWWGENAVVSVVGANILILQFFGRPSTIIGPIFYSACTIFHAGYVVLFYLRSRILFEHDRLAREAYNALRIFSWIEVLSVAYFGTIFATPGHIPEAWLTAYVQFVFVFTLSQWKNLFMQPTLSPFHLSFVLLFSLVVALYFLCLVAQLGNPSASGRIVFQVVDVGFTALFVAQLFQPVKGRELHFCISMAGEDMEKKEGAESAARAEVRFAELDGQAEPYDFEFVNPAHRSAGEGGRRGAPKLRPSEPLPLDVAADPALLCEREELLNKVAALNASLNVLTAQRQGSTQSVEFDDEQGSPNLHELSDDNSLISETPELEIGFEITSSAGRSSIWR